MYSLKDSKLRKSTIVKIVGWLIMIPALVFIVWGLYEMCIHDNPLMFLAMSLLAGFVGFPGFALAFLSDRECWDGKPKDKNS